MRSHMEEGCPQECPVSVGLLEDSIMDGEEEGSTFERIWYGAGENRTDRSDIVTLVLRHRQGMNLLLDDIPIKRRGLDFSGQL